LGSPNIRIKKMLVFKVFFYKTAFFDSEANLFKKKNEIQMFSQKNGAEQNILLTTYQHLQPF